MAGASGTMNLDKKKNFQHINTKAKDGSSGTFFAIFCEDIKKVLNGSGTCKVFRTTSSECPIAYNCDGENVVGAGDVGLCTK